MKFAAALVALVLLTLPAARLAAQAAPPPTAAQTELRALVEKVTVKMRAGQATPAGLAPELAEFERLEAKYAATPAEAAEIAAMRATVFWQVLDDTDKASEVIVALQKAYPGTPSAQRADRMLQAIEKGREAQRLQAKLIGQPAPELTFTWASRTGLQKLSDLKGRVVVLDFWATWCGPCIHSFPEIREHVAHFKNSPVTFLGVTSLQGRVHGIEAQPIDTKGNPQKEYELMPQFMQLKNMTWDVAFSEQNVFNADYGIQGIPFVAIIAPDGTLRHAGLHPADPKADIAGKITALLREFGLTAPGA